MRFSTLSTTAVAYLAYNTAANPIAEPLPVELMERQAGVGAGSCVGPIVNVVTYTATGCTNPGTTSQNLNLLKFAPIPTEPNKDFESRCEQVSLPTEDDATAKSFAFIADGFTRDCYLVTYSGDNCGSNDARTQALRFGSSRCINEVIGSVKVYCLASRATIPRDVGDDETGDTSPVLPWNEVQ